MRIFKTPKRRPARKKSGFGVSGKTTGGECKIIPSEYLDISSKELTLTFEKKIDLIESFGKNLAFIAVGGYILPSKKISVKFELNLFDIHGNQLTTTKIFNYNLDKDKWTKIGDHILFDINNLEKKSGKFIVNILLENSEDIGKTNFFGFNVDVVKYYEGKDDHWEHFNQKTSIYIPGIYYFNSEEAFVVKPNEYQKLGFQKGECVVLKSCNRCARYLLVDINKQENDLSFSRHCVSRAPCTHPLFSTYRIVENNCDPEILGPLKSHFGYQLECKSCKKFYVNAPLNPMRNSTQHREDSLRRRAFELLAGTALNLKWIFHTHRLSKNKDKEFDVHIWEKFGKKCFKCKKDLPKISNMDLDHTFPISLFWSLDETATCLCGTCNSKKSDKFPVEFYSPEELKELSGITGIKLTILETKPVNEEVLKYLQKNVVWLFDVFLSESDYQKIRDGKRTADNIYRSIVDAINLSTLNIDLVKEYYKKKNKFPDSITTDKL